MVLHILSKRLLPATLSVLFAGGPPTVTSHLSLLRRPAIRRLTATHQPQVKVLAVLYDVGYLATSAGSLTMMPPSKLSLSSISG